MDALLAVSGLLAALGVGAVGVGYYRTTGGGSGSSSPTPLDPAQTTAIDGAAVAAGHAADDIFDPPPKAPVQAISAPLPSIVKGPSTVAGFTPTPAVDPDVAHSDPPPAPVSAAAIGKKLGGIFGGSSAVQIL